MDGSEERVVVYFLLLLEKPGFWVTGKEKGCKDVNPGLAQVRVCHRCEELHGRSMDELGRGLRVNKAGAESKTRQASSFRTHDTVSTASTHPCS